MNEKNTQEGTPAMTPERWQQIKRIFDQVIETETGSREGLLTAACSGDADLRAEVEKLLRGHELASGFIEQPAVAKAAHILQISVEDALIGQQIGQYKVLREIGHGGMGQVYLAVRADDEYKKRVALKIIKRGMDTQEIIRRFRNERQILAGLDHPNIGKLLDGGTTEDGLPYFAMEYVAGKPITDYCDDRKLSTIERLKLFRLVCAAIQFAHQNLVVHRDIKPSNILVTEDGTPKLLDFGIAKVLNPELSGQTIDPTATALRLMTPEYASPEQVRGETITTASDVYSLGVVLYELLTGHRPYRVKSRLPHEILRIVCEEEPEKPSTAISRTEEGTSRDGSKPITLTPESVSRTREGEPDKLRRRLRGDLDNIVLMAMRKEPQRRYTTVNQLSEDIRRHLDELPVIARQDTMSYRFEKFIQRNRGVATAATAALLILFIGIVATAWQAHVASNERSKAEKRFNDVRKLANAFVFDIHDDIEKLPGATRAREKLVKYALEYLDSLAQESSSDTTLRTELAKAYLKVGDVQGAPSKPNLGDTAGALQSYRKALAIAGSLIASRLSNDEVKYLLAISHNKVGDGLEGTGNIKGAVESRRKSISILDELITTNSRNTEAKIELAKSLISLGEDLGSSVIALNLNDNSAALENYRRAQTTLEEIVSSDSNNTQARRFLARCYDRISDSLGKNNDETGAINYSRKALEIRESLAMNALVNAEARRDLAVGYHNHGVALVNRQDYAGGLEKYRQAEAIYQELAAADPLNVTARRDVAIIQRNIAWVRLQNGAESEALASYEKVLGMFQDLSKIDPANTRINIDLAGTCEIIADLFKAKGNYGEAIENYRKGVASLEQAANNSPNSVLRHEIADKLNSLGYDLEEVGDADNALECKRKALELREAMAKMDPGDKKARQYLANSYSSLGDHLIDIRENAGALDNFRKAHAIFEKLAADDAKNNDARRTLAYSHSAMGIALSKNGIHSDAVSNQSKALAIFEELSKAEPTNDNARFQLGKMLTLSGKILAAAGQNTQAMESYRKGLAMLEELAANPNYENVRLSLYLELYRAAIFFSRIGQAVESRQMAARSLALRKEMTEHSQNPGTHINNYAFALSHYEPADLRNPKTALIYAKRAFEMSKGRTSYVLDTLAWVYHQNGDNERAINLVEEASMLITGNSRRHRDFTADIAKFKAAALAKSGNYFRASELVENALDLLDEDSERRPIFEADLAKYRAAIKGKAK